MKYFFFTVCVVIAFKISYGQEVLYTANDYYKELKYFKAIPEYKKALKKKSTYIATERLANCYRNLNNTEESEFWYKKTFEFPTFNPYNHFYYAQALKSNGKFEEAKNQFLIWGEKMIQYSDDAIALAESCNIANNYLNNPENYLVINLEKLNTPFSEFCPSKSPNGFLFATDVLDKNDSLNNLINEQNGRGYTKIYEARIQDTILNKVIKLNQIINEEFNNGPACYSKNTDTIVFSRTTIDKLDKFKINNLQLFFGIKDSAGNYKIKPFIYNDDEFSFTHPNISEDGLRLYFSSDMPGGYGGKDLYLSTKDLQGVWSKPVNLGDSINTRFDEEFPFEFENKELYFSSNGFQGMGGFDFYKSKIENEEYIQPVNLKSPLNSLKDDLGIFFQKDSVGKINGYFSSNRLKGKGLDDIYYFELQKRDTIKVATLENLQKDSIVIEDESKIILKQLKIQNLQLFAKEYTDSNGLKKKNYFIKGNVLEDNLEKELPINLVEINIIDKNNGEGINTESNDLGEFIFKHSGVKKYIIRAKKKGYFTNSVEFNVDKLPNENEQVDLGVKKSNDVLENIEYEFNDFKLLPESKIQLNKLVTILSADPNLKIEMYSYTDARGSETYNLSLSKKRAKSAKDYIISQGISPNRIKSFGYGETNLIIENAIKEEDHQLNRRTEFKLIKVQVQ